MTDSLVPRTSPGHVAQGSGFDLDDPLQFVDLDRLDLEFAALRATPQLVKHAGSATASDGTTGNEYWSVVRYADIVRVTLDTESFRSAPSTNIPDDPPDGSLINSDGERHLHLRRIVKGLLSSRHLEDRLNPYRVAESLLSQVPVGEPFDFVAAVAAPFPLLLLCQLAGVPASEYHLLLTLTNGILGATDPDYGGDRDFAKARAGELGSFGWDLVRASSGDEDSLVGALARALAAKVLDPDEVRGYFVMFFTAGNETSRTALSHAMAAFAASPHAWDSLLQSDATGQRAVIEEVLRWASPIHHQRRTAVRRCQVAGQQIEPGEKVVLWYSSGNRDETFFRRPYRFDVARWPNQHVAFGAPGGRHHCVGAPLARLELRAMLRHLSSRFASPRLDSEPVFLASNFLRGVKRLDLVLDRK
jgi:cytochrome P450